MTLTSVRAVPDVAAADLPSYHATFQHAPQGTLVTDTTGRILEANRRAASLLGGGSPGALRGRLLADFVSARDRRAFRVRLAHLCEAGPEATDEWEAKMRPEKGEPFEAALSVAAVPEALAAGPPVCIFTLRDVTTASRAREKLQARLRHQRSLAAAAFRGRHSLRALAAQAIGARDAEARRVALEIQGEVAQMLAAAQLAIDETVRELPVALHERPLWVKALLDGVDNRLRRIAYELRPAFLDEGGLGPALGFLAESFSARVRVPVDIDGDLGVARLPTAIETTLYRVVEEALANVARHAKARRVRVRLQSGEGSLVCSVRDDGGGFDPEAPRRQGLGLLGLVERVEGLGGRLEIVSAASEGTELIATVPLQGVA